MSCKKIQWKIQAVVDGAATRADREAVDAHLRQCEACARVMEESRRLVMALAAAPRRQVSDDFERNLAAALESTAPVSRGAAGWERLRLRFEWRLRVPAMVTAGSLAAALLAGLAAPGLLQVREERSRETGQYVATVLEQHRQLEASRPRVDPDVVQASIELSTGDVFTP